METYIPVHDKAPYNFLQVTRLKAALFSSLKIRAAFYLRFHYFEQRLSLFLYLYPFPSSYITLLRF